MSPFSVSSGLHVLLLGADGNTREQLEEILTSNSDTHLELQKINHVRNEKCLKFNSIIASEGFLETQAA